MVPRSSINWQNDWWLPPYCSTTHLARTSASGYPFITFWKETFCCKINFGKGTPFNYVSFLVILETNPWMISWLRKHASFATIHLFHQSENCGRKGGISFSFQDVLDHKSPKRHLPLMSLPLREASSLSMCALTLKDITTWGNITWSKGKTQLKHLIYF